MKEEEKEKLLLTDLSSRLPYGVMIYLEQTNEIEELYCLNIPQEAVYTRNKEHHNISSLCPIGQCKPYLRSMSSMTKKEKKEFNSLINGVEERCINAYGKGGYTLAFIEVNDWLNSRHFDYRGLIEKGLAIEATNDIYKD